MGSNENAARAILDDAEDGLEGIRLVANRLDWNGEAQLVELRAITEHIWKVLESLGSA